MDLETLSRKTLADLREIARLAGVKSVTTYRKEQLIRKLISLHNEAPELAPAMQIENTQMPQNEVEIQHPPEERRQNKQQRGEKGG